MTPTISNSHFSLFFSLSLACRVWGGGETCAVLVAIPPPGELCSPTSPARTPGLPGFALRCASRAGPTCVGRGEKSARVIGPCFGQATGAPELLPSRQTRGSGAPNDAPNKSRRAANLRGSCLRSAWTSATQSSLRRMRRLICVKDAAPIGAPLRRFLASGPCFRRGGIADIQTAFAALLPHLVQPLKADPFVGRGR